MLAILSIILSLFQFDISLLLTASVIVLLFIGRSRPQQITWRNDQIIHNGQHYQWRKKLFLGRWLTVIYLKKGWQTKKVLIWCDCLDHKQQHYLRRFLQVQLQKAISERMEPS